MPALDTFSLGLLLGGVGLGVWLFARSLTHRAAPVVAATPALAEPESVQDEAVLIIQSGGRVVSMNPRARRMFHLREGEQPGLERLARQVRPAESFLQLCATGDAARFVLGGRLVDASSYRLSLRSTSVTVISLRDPGLTASLAAGEGKLTAGSMQTFMSALQAMASSLDLLPTLENILLNIEKLVPGDWMEITLYDPNQDRLVPYRLNTAQNGERRLEISSAPHRLDQGYSGMLARRRRPILISDITEDGDLPISPARAQVPLRAYLGVPLQMEAKFIGTLELASLTPGVFHLEDLSVVEMMAGQAAIAIHNAMAYESEHRRTAELSGLAQLSQAFGSARDPQTIFSRLVQSILQLMPVGVLGFLLYDETQRVLSGQAPFHGLPDEFLEMYRVQVQPNSPLEQALMSQDVLITEDAAGDAQWENMGLGSLARGASLRDTVLVPLFSGGRVLGYLQASNHEAVGMSFSQDELHMLLIVANQVAPVIDNFNLIQQSRQRAMRAEALRRIASLASSSASLDEILLYSLRELGRLLKADVAAIFLVDQLDATLRLHPGSASGPTDLFSAQPAGLRLDDPQYPFTVSGSQRAVFSPCLSEDLAVVPFYRAVQVAWGIESVMIAPLVVHDEGIGEIWIGSSGLNSFDKASLQVVATAAGQLAGVVEQSRLSAQTDESLRRRVEQLSALTRVNRELSTSLDLRHQLHLVYDEALQTTRADCGSILLFDLSRPSPGSPRTRFFIGEQPPEELSEFEKKALAAGAPLNIEDADADAFAGSHPGIASALMVPIIYQNRQAGLMVLHSRSPRHFDATAVEIAQSLAVQTAVVLGNALQSEQQARQSEALKRELDALGSIFDLARAFQPGLPLDQQLEGIGQAILSATPFQMVVISLYDPRGDCLRRVYSAGLPPETWAQLQSRTQPWSALHKLMLPQYRVGGAYYLPADQSVVVPDEVHTVTVLPELHNHEADVWDPEDMLLVPLLDPDERPLGLISVDAPRDGRRPDWQAFEALDLFALQTANIIRNYHAFSQVESEVRRLEDARAQLSVDQKAIQLNLAAAQDRHAQDTGTLHILQRQNSQTQAGLEAAEQAGQQLDLRAAVISAAGVLAARLGLPMVLIGERGPGGASLVEMIGEFPAGVNPRALFGGRNPLRQVLQDGQVLLVNDLEQDPDWQGSVLLSALGARSLIGLPLTINAAETAGLLLVGSAPQPAYTDQDRQAFEQIARQVSVSLQNMHLLAVARRRLAEMDTLLNFSRKLGSLDPVETINTLLVSALQIIPAAQAGWAGLGDNPSGELMPQVAAGYVENETLVGMHLAGLENFAGQGQGALPLPLRVVRDGRPQQVADVQFSRDYNLPPEDLMRYRRATGGRLPVSALALPLRLGEATLGVLVLENFSSPAVFSDEDENLALSLAQQAALALENAHLLHAARQRAAQLQALTRVAGKLTANLRTADLISSLLDELDTVVPFDTATLWLRSGQELSVAAARGFEDNPSLLGLSARVEDSQLFLEMLRTGSPLCVPDVRLDPRFPALVEPERASWLGIPLIVQSDLIGVIAIDMQAADFYSADQVQIAATFAGQAAVALENARLFEESAARAAELDQRSRRLGLLNRLSGDLAASLDSDYILRLTAQELVSALNVSRVAVVLRGEQGCRLPVEIPAWDQELPLDLPATPVFARLQESLGLFLSSNVAAETELAGLYEDYLQPRGIASILLVPLLTGTLLHGWLLLLNDTAHRFSLPEIELARTIANQAATAVQNARLTEDLEQRVRERTAELSREHQNSHILLRIISELSASLDMDLVLNRTLQVLNETLGAEQSLIMLTSGSLKSYTAGENLAGARSPNGRGTRVDQMIARSVVSKRAPLLIPDLSRDADWSAASPAPPGYSSVLAVPLALGQDVLGSMLLLHRQPGFFVEDRLRTVEAAARQISISINNAELFNLIRDQSENLGGMLREQQVEASRSRGILEAVADGVLVTDARNTIYLLNASAGRILGLDAGQVLGQSLEHFIGLFGTAAADWMETIRSWSADPLSYQPGLTFSEQLELDTGQVVSVHLAPVILGKEFLGTVSIFRDITHQIQIDRLKSEFVANVSHELRTPMTSIKGYVDVLLMGAAGELQPLQVHFLEIVKNNAARLSVLVNDLLDVSKIESGQVRLSIQALDLREIAQEVISDFNRRSQTENRPMAFALDIAPGLPRVRGDLERARQVLSNLVSNAYLYTPAGGQVTVTARPCGNEVQVDVRDNGVGILPRDQHRVFERFYRGEDPLVLASAGTGLGLSITRSIIEMHAGRIWCSSSGVAGEGSVFSFTLPVHQPLDN